MTVQMNEDIHSVRFYAIIVKRQASNQSTKQPNLKNVYKVNNKEIF